MSDLKRTELRHKLLAEVAAGLMEIYRGSQWNLTRKPGKFLPGAQARQAALLRLCIEGRGYSGGFSEAVLSDAGRVLLTEWNEQYGEVQS
jgi:hypothetical protein